MIGFLYIACFLLLFSTEGKSQIFNQDADGGNPIILSPTVVNQKESFSPFNNTFNNNSGTFFSPLRSDAWDDDPNSGGTGLGELPVSDNLLVILLLAVAYAIFIAFCNRRTTSIK